MSTAAIRAGLAARGVDHESPYGCTWCGEERAHHGRRWAPTIQMHSWEAPREAQILDRMRYRRAVRLAAEPARPHVDAYTSWPDGDPICATCNRRDCARYWRIQRHLDRQHARRRAQLPPAGYDEESW